MAYQKFAYQYRSLDVDDFNKLSSTWRRYFPVARDYFPKRTDAAKRIIYLEDYAHLAENFLERLHVIKSEDTSEDRIKIPINWSEQHSAYVINSTIEDLLKTPKLDGVTSSGGPSRGFIVDPAKVPTGSDTYSDYFQSIDDVKSYLRSFALIDDNYIGENTRIEKSETIERWYSRLLQMGHLFTRARTRAEDVEMVIGNSSIGGYDKFQETTEKVTESFSSLVFNLSSSSTAFTRHAELNWMSGYAKHYPPYGWPTIGSTFGKDQWILLLYTFYGNKADGSVINGGSSEYRLRWLKSSSSTYQSVYNDYGLLTRYGFPARQYGKDAEWRESLCRAWYEKRMNLAFHASVHPIGYIFKDWILSYVCNVLNYRDDRYYVW